ncbi:nuclear transport factor 2 family protein [Agromyces aurantiacus]|uniref:Nuclear transport factor 2 family protein n=1 Tax=Agromyces aurantiacus TaxID=165814 RepID=A0ABV9R6P8_9MICO|nr:nuclear transport factor 2 family protein [Agromyces aurantiacus]MBM7503990.1 ketosteroid isomerase-like protein [Agromyces aurantiacus]
MSAGTDWVDGYIRAWETNDPDDIAAIFADDAIYEFSPDDPEALRGREAIVDGWLDSKDEPGDWTFDWEVLVESDDLVMVQGRTDYPNAKLYDNLWVIRLAPDGRATRFTEWYMERDR